MLKRLVFLLVLGAAPISGVIAAGEKLPKDAPYCAAPNARPLFVSPMGQPFRGEKGQPYPSAAWFAEADTNHDGVIDRIEFITDADRFFKTLDKNHDGKLDPDEVIAYERDVAPEIALYGPRTRDVVLPVSRSILQPGDSGYGGPMGAGRYTWLNIPEPVASTDDDVDRMIAEKEFRGAAGRRFEMLDSAGRGSIALKDLPKTPYQQTMEGPCRPRPKPKHRPGERPGLDTPDGLPGDPNATNDRDRYPPR